jgi:hypothetical protein
VEFQSVLKLSPLFIYGVKNDTGIQQGDMK